MIASVSGLYTRHRRAEMHSTASGRSPAHGRDCPLTRLAAFRNNTTAAPPGALSGGAGGGPQTREQQWSP
jgi:hypothetical protein